MDYSGLVKAVIEEDELTTSRLCDEATPILTRYLIVKMGANQEDARDAVQQMFEYVIPRVKSGEIKNPAGFLAYMLSTCRHSYLKVIEQEEHFTIDEQLDSDVYRSEIQIWALVDQEKKKVLSYCIEKLNRGYRTFIRFLFDFPDADTDDIAEHFGISRSNAWTRKHRILNKLSECISINF